MTKFSTYASALAILVTGGLAGDPVGAQAFHVNNHSGFEGRKVVKHQRHTGGTLAVRVNRHFGIIVTSPAAKPRVYSHPQAVAPKKTYKPRYYTAKPVPHHPYRNLHQHNGYIAPKPRLQSRHIPYKGLKRRSNHRVPHRFFRR